MNIHEPCKPEVTLFNDKLTFLSVLILIHLFWGKFSSAPSVVKVTTKDQNVSGLGVEGQIQGFFLDRLILLVPIICMILEFWLPQVLF